MFGSNTAFLHTWTQRWNSGTRGVTGMEISQSISRGAVAKKCAQGGSRKRSQVSFQAFQSQVTS